MRLKGLGQRPLVFIVHSLGGLLVKEILRTAYTQNHPEWTRISAETVGVLFLATPHSGASLATLVDLFRVITRRNWTIRDLAAHEPHLRDLNEWFRSNFDSLGIKAHVLRESQAVRGLTVVTPSSADPGIALVRVIPVDKNHINICKPTSRDDHVFLETRQFITDCIHSAKPRQEHQQESGSVILTTQAGRGISESQLTPSTTQGLDSSAPPLELSCVTIGILTTLSEEYAACRGVFDPNGAGTEKDFSANNGRLTCWVCRIKARYGGHHLIAIARSPDMGPNSGAITTSLLLRCCPEMSQVILCGIAGAIPYPQKPQDHVRIGDIVVTNRDGVIQYDFGKQHDPRSVGSISSHHNLTNSFQGFKFRSAPRAPCPHLLAAVDRMHSDEELLGPKDRREWERKVDDYLKLSRDRPKWKRPPASRDRLIDTPGGATEIPHPKDALRRSGVPRVFHGPIGSANTVLADPIRRDYLRDTLGIKAVEMEATGLADACLVATIGYLVIRGTYYYCNSAKSGDWHHYAALIAAAYAQTVVEYLHPRPSTESKAAGHTTFPSMLEVSTQPVPPGAGPATNQSFHGRPAEPRQLPREQQDIPASNAQPQPFPTSSFSGPVEGLLSSSTAQLNERNAQIPAAHLTQTAKVQSLVDQIQTLLMAGRHRPCASLANDLELLLQSLPRQGTPVRDGWIILARLEDQRLHMAKQERKEIDIGRLRRLLKEAENVVD